MKKLAQTPQQSTFPKSVQPGVPKLKPAPKGWRTYTFGQLFEVFQRPITLRDDQEYDLVTVKRARGGIERRARLYGSAISVKSQFLLKEGDFLISKRQIVHGACGVVSALFENSIVSNEYAVLRCKEELDLNFLWYLTFSIYFQQTCFHSSVGVHVEKMIFKLDDWFKWPINIPPLAEQKKIGLSLTTVDAKLDALRRKHIALKSYKNGLMQKLFSRAIRFVRSDGTSFPDWSEQSFGELYEFIATNSLTRDSLSDSEEEVQNIHYGDIHTRFKSQFRQEDERVPFIKPESMPDQIEDEQFCRVGDIVIADASEDYADIGKAIEILSVRDKTLVAGLHTFIARPRSMETVVGYAGYMLQTYSMRRQIMRIAQGISVLGISKPKLAKLRVPLPHPDEQRKIADALAAVDAKIQAIEEQIERIEAFKKGLVQKVFA